MGAKLRAAIPSADTPRAINRLKNANYNEKCSIAITFFHAVMNQQKRKIRRYHVQIDMFQ